MICYHCPKCNESLSYPDSMSGEKETCPACGNVSFIPFKTAESPRPSDMSEQSSSVEQDQSIRQQQTWKPTCPLCGCRLEKWTHGLPSNLLSAVVIIVSLIFSLAGLWGMVEIYSRSSGSTVTHNNTLGNLIFGLLLMMSVWFVRGPEHAWLCTRCGTKTARS